MKYKSVSAKYRNRQKKCDSLFTLHRFVSEIESAEVNINYRYLFETKTIILYDVRFRV